MWAALLGSLLGILNKVLGWITRREHRQAGQNIERLKQSEQANEARKRMDAVKPPSPDDIVDRLRRGKF